MLQILTPEGELLADPPMDLERPAASSRRWSPPALRPEGTAMQKQGRLATYAPFEGQEAAQIGAAAALRPDDWVVADLSRCGRDVACTGTRG